MFSHFEFLLCFSQLPHDLINLMDIHALTYGKAYKKEKTKNITSKKYIQPIWYFFLIGDFTFPIGIIPNQFGTRD